MAGSDSNRRFRSSAGPVRYKNIFIFCILDSQTISQLGLISEGLMKSINPELTSNFVYSKPSSLRDIFPPGGLFYETGRI